MLYSNKVVNKTKVLGVRIDKDTLNRLKVISKKKSRSVSNMVLVMINDYLKREYIV